MNKEVSKYIIKTEKYINLKSSRVWKYFGTLYDTEEDIMVPVDSHNIYCSLCLDEAKKTSGVDNLETIIFSWYF